MRLLIVCVLISLTFGQWGFIKDGSLEDSTNNYSFTWNVTQDPLWDDILCTLENCDYADRISPGPHSGKYFAWFAGALGKRLGTLSQRVLVPGLSTSSIYFCFWLQISSTGPNTGLLRVWQNDVVIAQFTYRDAKDYSRYKQTCVWITHGSEDTIYTFLFEHTSYRDPQYTITHFSVDDISTKLEKNK